MPRYAINGAATNTASATLPLLTLIGSAAIRPTLYELLLGSDATADNSAKYQIQRCTTAGTAGSAITPVPLDPLTSAAVGTSGLAVFSGGPNLTANLFLLTIGMHQRATFRWVVDPSMGIIAGAAANSGLALMSQVVTTAFNADLYMAYVE